MLCCPRTRAAIPLSKHCRCPRPQSYRCSTCTHTLGTRATVSVCYSNRPWICCRSGSTCFPVPASMDPPGTPVPEAAEPLTWPGLARPPDLGMLSLCKCSNLSPITTAEALCLRHHFHCHHHHYHLTEEPNNLVITVAIWGPLQSSPALTSAEEAAQRLCHRACPGAVISTLHWENASQHTHLQVKVFPHQNQSIKSGKWYYSIKYAENAKTQETQKIQEFVEFLPLKYLVVCQVLFLHLMKVPYDFHPLFL